MGDGRAYRAARAASIALALATALRPVGTAGAQLVVLRNEGRAAVRLEYGGAFPPARSDERHFGPNGGAAVAEQMDVFGRRTRAVQTGYGLNAVAAEGVLGDVGFFSYRADTGFEIMLGNGGARAGEELFFEYVINGGELRLRAPNGSFDGLVASVGATIFTIAPGFSGFLWSWGLELRGSGGTVMATETQIFGDALGLGTPPVGAISFVGGEAVVSVGHFSGGAELGPLGRSGTALITYDMFASISGPGLNVTGGSARLGDPFDVDGAPGAVFAIRGLADLEAVQATVPEPATGALVALGLAGVGLVARAARRRHGPGVARSDRGRRHGAVSAGAGDPGAHVDQPRGRRGGA